MGGDYKQYKNAANAQDVRDIVNVSRAVGMPQRVVYSAVDIYYRYRHAYPRLGSTVSVEAACIVLSGKMCGSLRSLEQVLRSSYDYHRLDADNVSFEKRYSEAVEAELRACVALDFDLEAKDPYGYLERLCTEHSIDRTTAQTIWVVLNDTMYLPLAPVFCTKSIVVSCVFVSTLIGSLESSFAQFKHAFEDTGMDDSDILFISEEIISLYENTLERTQALSAASSCM